MFLTLNQPEGAAAKIKENQMCKRNKMLIRVAHNCELCPLFCSMSRLKTLGRTLEILSERFSPTCWFWTSNQCKETKNWA